MIEGESDTAMRHGIRLQYYNPNGGPHFEALGDKLALDVLAFRDELRGSLTQTRQLEFRGLG